jgi:SAM-dependent methyltransferase
MGANRAPRKDLSQSRNSLCHPAGSPKPLPSSNLIVIVAPSMPTPASTAANPPAPDISPGAPVQSARYDGLRLFALSFAALFLELMVIRWVPAVVRFVAYYSNLMLISSFLGLGLGAMMARRRWNLLSWFPALLVLNIGSLLLCRRIIQMPAADAEARFGPQAAFISNYLVLIGIFILNTAVFVPLGQQIGRLFRQPPPLRAYAFDLGGSLCGTIVFGLFSLYHFSPSIGVGIVAVIFLAISRRHFLRNSLILVCAVLLMPLSVAPTAIWSPYYYVTIHPSNNWNLFVSAPEPGLQTTQDPDLYIVSVNTDFYQWDGTLDLRRYTPAGKDTSYVRDFVNPEYLLPYLLHPQANKVCVVGAGGGLDVQAALMSGAHHVDAVEIDPTLIDIARRFNASGVYDDPRVQIHINDARAFFQSAQGGYDMVIFGLLDSQALFSYSNNIRLDGYIYTVQSIRKAFSLLKPDGMLCISFVVPRNWLMFKLIEMTRAATGREPVVYGGNGRCILGVSRNLDPSTMPPQISVYHRGTGTIPAIDLPTDDWPYLYLSRRTIPNDYLIVAGSLLALSAIVVFALWWTDRESRLTAKLGFADTHFLLLGLGFLLLETKSIGDCSLYFGTTWFVTMVVVSGVLLMVLLANAIAMHLLKASPWFYLPLLLSLAFLYFVPRDTILGLPFTARLLWAVLIVPLPIFFAGLIFSTTFRDGGDPATLLAANLIGATIGGFLEYLAMAIGTRDLLMIVAAAYIGSFVCRALASRPQLIRPAI